MLLYDEVNSLLVTEFQSKCVNLSPDAYTRVIDCDVRFVKVPKLSRPKQPKIVAYLNRK